MSLHLICQKLLPKQALTRLAGAGAHREGGALTQWAIRRFIDHYGVAMQEAANPDPAAYRTFNDFFTRALRDGARPLADAPLICPVDGAVSQLGDIHAGRIFQVKGHQYSATALLGGDEALASHFTDGRFATIYLSPRDYHRIHMPCAGQLRQMIHVPANSIPSAPPPPPAYPASLPATNASSACSTAPLAPGRWCWWGPPSSAAWPPSGTAPSTRRGRAGSGGGCIPQAVPMAGVIMPLPPGQVWTSPPSAPCCTLAPSPANMNRSVSNKVQRWGAFCSAPPW